MESNRLDLIPGKIAPVVHASQYDVGRVFRIYLYDGTAPFTLNGSETITCAIRKTDNNIVVLNVENTASNYVDIVTTEQATACAGQNICELRIEDGDTNIGTMDFILQVESDPTEGGIQSETEIANLRTQVSEMVGEEVADQYDAEAVVFDNAPTEGHGIGFAVTSEGIKTAIKEATNPEGEVTGDIVSFDDALNGIPFIEVEAQIEATQSGSGTPSPDNPRPINGFDDVVINVAGKNLAERYYNSQTATQGTTITPTEKGVRVTGTTTGRFPVYLLAPQKHLPLKEGDKITISIFQSGDISFTEMPFIGYYRDSSTYGGTIGILSSQNDFKVTWTVPSDYANSKTSYINAYLYIPSGKACDFEIGLQIEFGDTATAFEPFKGSTHTIDLGQTVGKGVLNVTTGELTITHKVVSLTEGMSGGTVGGVYVFFKTIENAKTVSDSEIAPVIAEQYEAIRYNGVTGTVNTIAIRSNGYLYVNTGNSATTPQGIALYELATPVTVQLTPEEVKAISGLNTVSANSGDIRVVYRKDFGIVADSVPYDNTESGLTADNVQDAIDEVADTLADKADTADLATVATSGLLGDLTNVTMGTLRDLDRLTYNSSASRWENKQPLAWSQAVPSDANITNVNGGIYALGNLIIVCIHFHLGADKTQYQPLFSGLPQPIANDCGLFIQKNGGGNGASAGRVYNGTFYPNQNIQANANYNIFGAYIAST